MAAAAMSDAEMGQALWDAAGAGKTGEVTRLLEAGAPVNWANRRSGQSPLIKAAQKGHVELMRVLLDRGADLEAKDNNGWTALIWAARNCHVEAVALLLDRGADPEVRDNDGRSALDLCRPGTCRSALLGAEHLQRWRRRRLLVTWRH
ncbi:hypothetical protein FNF28_04395 [Cafeteria roenbergensis]|uniref:Uncharacterized protein n=1 Tax=Cafeteria roenbergensis TaxID=33653 RepID=A0A5A8DD78_CAFRO|nr:hypothetical protein FNF28_04395 [Cafeteria roenbergensis]